MADFTELAHLAQASLNEIQNIEDHPMIEKSAQQIINQAEELHRRMFDISTSSETKASQLLSRQGIDLEKLQQKLDLINTKKTFETLEPIADTDVQSFLRNEKQNAILSVIDEVQKNSFETAQKQKWQHVMSEWKQEKLKIMNALIGHSQNWLDIKKGPEQTILNETTSVTGISCLNNQEMAYAREVYEYNRLVIEGALRPNLVQKFARVAEDFKDAKINDMWEVMKYMVNIASYSKSQDPLKTRTHNTHFVEQAKKYLENRYKVYMTTVVSEHLKEAQRGGIPSIEKLVSAYVGLKFSNYNTSTSLSIGLVGYIDNKPLWPMIYYCLRCGDVQTTRKLLENVASKDNELILKAIEEKCSNPDHRINQQLELLIRNMYKNSIQNSTDAYQRAVYCILGCCDIKDQHPDVAKTSDDFLWIQLSLIRSDNGDSAEALTYSALQKMIIEEYGERHFNANEKPIAYFQMLALTGQFEAAIEFLSRFERYRTHAVHIALAMNELYMLAGPRNVQAPLLSVDVEDPAPLRRLNLARLVMLYVKKFEITDPAEALQYFYFLRKFRDPENKNLFLVCVSDLAIECRDYDLIFGKMQPNGIRSRGAIDQFESIDIDVKEACEMVGQDHIKKGMFEDAIKMFDLAENYELALRYMTILLSQVVHQPNKPGSLRERQQMRAFEMARRYDGTNVQCDSNAKETFHTLLTVSEFFDKFHDKNYQSAMEFLEKTRLVPLKVLDLGLCMQNFKRLGGEVLKVYPDLLVAAMEIIYSQYKNIKSKDIPGKDDKLGYFREQAKAITNMAASVPYRMPGDTNNRLVQTEILMH